MGKEIRIELKLHIPNDEIKTSIFTANIILCIYRVTQIILLMLTLPLCHQSMKCFTFQESHNCATLEMEVKYKELGKYYKMRDGMMIQGSKRMEVVRLTCQSKSNH